MDTFAALQQEIAARLTEASAAGRKIDITVLAIHLSSVFQPNGIPYTKICAEIEKALAARAVEPEPC